ncbi:MAG: hypothetical protein J6A01_00510, partial [Proteobacteria bacterium]|nr:hypothetical protein [Pseudomonadota bacterium]
MNHRMHLMSEFGLFIGVLMVGGTIASCTLSELVYYGDDCEGATSVIIPGKNKVLCEKDVESSEVACAEYQKIMAEGFCPRDYSQCHISSGEQEDIYCHDGCLESQVLCDRRCVQPNDPKYCGAKGNCDSTDEKSEDYRGIECSADQICKNDGKGVYYCVSDLVCGAG